MGDPETVTQWLNHWDEDPKKALDQVYPLVSDYLSRIAKTLLKGESTEHTLNTQALVNEAYLVLVNQKQASFKSRQHFYRIAAMVMRRILVNHAKAKQREKRGAGQKPEPLSQVQVTQPQGSLNWEELLEIDQVLDDLKHFNQMGHQVVEYRFFGGYTFQEIAEFEGYSEVTARRHWATSRAWLGAKLGKTHGPMA
ncbi:MAG: sigma-70 family RNA polymerase sigma factor [Acidobacteria bacterium]|nr:sigma-70 family RNA polymerase sigma factor [Acidobacteriota bacterium]